MQDLARLPLINPDRPQRTVAWRGSHRVSQQQFLRDVHALASRLPDAAYALNLCEDRYHFTVAFAAVCLRGQVNLLPPSQAVGIIGEIAAAYPGSYALGDTAPPDLPLRWVAVSAGDAGATGLNLALPALTVPSLPADQVAALVFTSGSSGAPRAHAKTWQTLARTARFSARRFLGSGRPEGNLVATVPPQHMYGLETTVMMALSGNCAAHAGRAFFPADLRAVLEQVPAPRLLVTTPVHLRALLAATLPFPPLHLVLSATAPLDPELAAAVEVALGAQVHEIYGCTEAGSMASRRTVDAGAWRLYPGMRLSRQNGEDLVHGRHLPAPVVLPDILERVDKKHFHLRGRNTDLLKLGGKRGSLLELTTRLLRIPGVHDAVVFVPEPPAGREARPAALVVAPHLSGPQILAALEKVVDAVFLPRPLIRLAQLPRNELGKLPRALLLAELERLRA